MEPHNPTIDELMEFLRSADFSSLNKIDESIDGFAKHLDETYGPLGTDARNEFEQKQKEFVENYGITVSEDDEYITISIPTDLSEQ